MDGPSSVRRIATIGLTVAIFVAPFLALLFSAAAGLGLMAVALIATSVVLRDAAAGAVENFQGRLRAVIAINLVLAAACLAAMAWLVLRG